MTETTSPVLPIQTGPKSRHSIDTLGKNPHLSARPRQGIDCATCRSWWTGLNTSHCSGCHQTFTGLTAFDKHRDGDHAKGTRCCREPQSVGLVDAGRTYPCWGFESGDSEWWK